MKLERKNNKGWFELQKEDTEELSKGVYLFCETYDKKLKANTVECKLISSVIYISKRIESTNYINDNYKNMYEVVIVDREKEQKFIVQAKDLFDTSTVDNDFYKSAHNSGLILWESKKLLVDYLKLQEEQAEVIKGVENIGWCGDDYFISGFTTSEDCVFTGSAKNNFATGGSKEEQYKFLNNVLTEYPLVFFIFAYTQAGFFNRFLNEDHNQVLEVIGESSKGKSTTGKLCMSAYTNPANFASFNMTKMSITETMKFYNDGFIYFDEIGELKIKEDERTELVYTLANAMTKSRTKRLNKDGDFTTEKQARLFYSLLLGGEVSILKNIKKTGGLEARLCQIVLDNSTHLFENVDSAFIEDFNMQISKNYGWLAQDLIYVIKEEKDKIQTKYIEALDYVRATFNINSVIENRKIKILAYVYLSAVYITNIIYQKDELEMAYALIEKMLGIAYKAIFSNVSYNPEQDDQFKSMLSSLHLTHSKHFVISDSESLALDTYNETMKDFYGYIKQSKFVTEIQIVSTRLEEFCNSVLLDKDRLLSYIDEHGFLVKDKDKNKNRRTKKIKNVNYYVFKIPHLFFEDVDKELEENPFNQSDEIEYKPQIKI